MNVHKQLTTNNTFKNQNEEMLPLYFHVVAKNNGTNKVHAIDGSSSNRHLFMQKLNNSFQDFALPFLFSCNARVHPLKKKNKGM